MRCIGLLQNQMHSIDCRGLKCPIPILKVRLKLNKMNSGEQLSILADDPEYAQKAKVFAAKVKDSQEFLANVGLTAKLSPLTDKNLTLVYQDACHLLHGQKISVQPRQLLKQIPGVILKEPIDAALCCGSAGVYNMLQPEVAEELGKQKAENLINTGADLIASPNPGCSLQISKYLQGKTISVMHPMELLDYAIRGDKLEI